jgi:drug/metabolite transporter (DMT)-like permease
MKQVIIGATAIIIAAMLWGLDGVVLTPRLFNLDVVFAVFMLHAVPFVLMQSFLFQQYRYLARFDRKDWAILLLIALFGGAIGTLAIVKALFLVNFEHLSVVVLLQKLQPVFAIALAAVLLKERLRKNYIVWAAVAIGASYFLTFGFHLPHLGTGAATGKAALLSVLAAFSFGSATVFGKYALKKYRYYTVNFYRFGLTALIMSAVVLLTGKFSQLSAMTTQNWVILLIIAVTTGSGAIFLYYYGLTRVRAMVSTMCELMLPVSVIVFDYLVNKSMLSFMQWIAAAVMVYAVIKITQKE